MKRIMMTLGCLCMLEMAAQQGRVGINTETPRATLDIEKSPVAEPSDAQGVIFPHISTEERNTFAEVAEGTMIYNTTKKCLEIYTTTGEDQGWKCMGEIPPTAPNIPKPQITLEAKGIYSTKGVLDRLARCIDLGSDDHYYGNDKRVIFTMTNHTGKRIENIDLSNAVSIENGQGHSVRAENRELSAVNLEVGESKDLVYKLSGEMNVGILTAMLDYQGVQASKSIPVGQRPLLKGKSGLVIGSHIDVPTVGDPNIIYNYKWVRDYNKVRDKIEIRDYRTYNGTVGVTLDFDADEINRIMGRSSSSKIDLLIDMVQLDHGVIEDDVMMSIYRQEDRSKLEENVSNFYGDEECYPLAESSGFVDGMDYRGKGVIYEDGSIWNIGESIANSEFREFRGGKIIRLMVSFFTEGDGIGVNVSRHFINPVTLP